MLVHVPEVGVDVVAIPEKQQAHGSDDHSLQDRADPLHRCIAWVRQAKAATRGNCVHGTSHDKMMQGHGSVS